MKYTIHTIVVFLVVVVLMPLAASSCRNKDEAAPEKNVAAEEATEITKKKPIEKPSPAKMVAPETAELLANFEELFREQEQAVEAEEKAIQLEQHEIMTMAAINQTIDELLSLDPKKNKKRLKELTADLKSIGQPAIDALKSLLDQKLTSKQRRIVIMVLGALKTKGSGQELYKRAVTDKDALVREEALAALRKAEDKEAVAQQSVAAIDEALAEDTAKSKKDAQAHITALGAIGGESAVDKLYEIISTSDDLALQKQAVRALGDTKHDAAKRILIDLYEYNTQLAPDAAQALGNWKDEDVVTLFGNTVLDTSAPVAKRRAAIAGLGALQTSLARTLLANALKDKRQERVIHQDAVDVLIRSEKPIEREEVARLVSVYELTPVEYLPQMMQRLLAKGGNDTVELLRSRFTSFKQLKKIHAVRTLGRIQSELAFEMLLSAMETEKDAAVRREILGAMKGFKNEKVNAMMKEYIEAVAVNAKDVQERVTALNYLSEIDKAAATKIAESNLTMYTEKPLISASIKMLKKYGTDESLNELLAFQLQNTDETFTKRIDDAIKAIEARRK